MRHDGLIEELDFVLTHPRCDIRNLETFYNNCLFSYETVPLFSIVTHIRFKRPDLLNKWSKENDLIHKVSQELNLLNDEEIPSKQGLIINVDLTNEKAINGYYQVAWESVIDYETINAMFRKKQVNVLCARYGKVNLVGLVKVDEHKYNLYIKVKEQLK